MIQTYMPQMMYSFASQQAANEFLNNYKRNAASPVTTESTPPLPGKKGSSAGLIILLIVAGLLVVYVYQVNKQEAFREN